MTSSSQIRMDDNVYCQEPQRNFLNDLRHDTHHNDTLYNDIQHIDRQREGTY
jgi:hypothetical protein